jgi:hypothetical protein
VHIVAPPFAAAAVASAKYLNVFGHVVPPVGGPLSGCVTGASVPESTIGGGPLSSPVGGTAESFIVGGIPDPESMVGGGSGGLVSAVLLPLSAAAELSCGVVAPPSWLPQTLETAPPSSVPAAHAPNASAAAKAIAFHNTLRMTRNVAPGRPLLSNFQSRDARKTS